MMMMMMMMVAVGVRQSNLAGNFYILVKARHDCNFSPESS